MPNAGTERATTAISEPARSAKRTIDGVVDAVTADIAAAGLAPGDLIGREAELCLRYGVSPGRFRQAARLMEVRDIARMRAGKFGGLVVSHSSLERAARSLATQLELLAKNSADLLPLSKCLAFLSAQRAILVMSGDDAERLRFLLAETSAAEDMYDYSRRGITLFQAVAEITGNPLIELISAATMSALYHLTPQNVPLEKQHFGEALPHDIIDAIIAGDLQATFTFMTRRWKRIEQIDLLKTHAVAAALPPPRFTLQGTAARTRSEGLAHEMMAEIRREGWPAGHKLGGEPELLQRYGVSRGVFRQAVRILEDFGAVQMRRGKGGGLMVASVDPHGVQNFVLATLRARSPSQDDIRIVLQALVPLCLDMMDDIGASRTRVGEALSAYLSQTADPSAGAICSLLARVGRNEAMAFLIRMILALPSDAAQAETEGASVLREARALLDALHAGDRAAARRHLILLADAAALSA